MPKPTLKQFKELERDQAIEVLIDIIKELDLKELKSMSILAAPFGFWAPEPENEMPPLEKIPQDQLITVIEDGQWTKENYDLSAENKEGKLAYTSPPRVKDAENYWPFMRCKNVAKALNKHTYRRYSLPRSHYHLLEYLARNFKITVEELKKTNPHNLLQNNPEVLKVIDTNLRRFY